MKEEMKLDLNINDRSLNFIPVILVIFILLSSLLIFILPKQEFSENENKMLQKFVEPNLDNILSGQFMKKFDEYVEDHFSFRAYWLNLKTSIEKSLGKQENNNIYFGKDEYLLARYKKNNEENLNKIINIINKFKLNNNIDISIMLVPTSVEINSDKLPNFAVNDSQKETIDYIYNNLNGINTIDVYSELKIAKSNNQELYYRLDHHWNIRGAYYGYRAYCKASNIEYYKMNEFYTEVVTKEFNGTYYSKANEYNLKPDIIEKVIPQFKTNYTVEYTNENRVENTLYVNKYLNEKNKYGYFLDNNPPHIVITNNEVKDNSELLILKDSYANSFIPYIVNNYNKVHVIDLRYYSIPISTYLEENKNINNILILYNIATLEDDIGIKKLR